VLRAMMFNPDKRIQSAAALQVEVKKAMEIIAGGGSQRVQQDENAPMSAYQDDNDSVTNEGEGYVVMLVESKAGLQNAIRERLKARGYRVLVISDPNRALGRFSPHEDAPADCVIFGAAELGTLAVEAFNKFASDEHSKAIPGILLLDRSQSNIIAAAQRGPNRKLLALPLKVRELRVALKQLLSGIPRREIGTF